MERTLIKDIVDIKEKLVQIAGRVVNLRKLGNITFAIMQDRSGTIQTVWEKKISAKIGDIVSITGEIRKDTRAKGGCEIAGDKIEIIATNAEDYPIDLSKAELTLQLKIGRAHV